MATETVNEQSILQELNQLPKERWREVLTFIRSLDAPSPSDKGLMTAVDLLQSGLVGLWADRADIGDSQQFARRLREQAQTRRRHQ
jgi:hypothetical protein